MTKLTQNAPKARLKGRAADGPGDDEDNRRDERMGASTLLRRPLGRGLEAI
jgi:hypothetical protein